MPKSYQSHTYSSPSAFKRLMLLIATLIRYPSIGSADVFSGYIEDGEKHDSIQILKKKLKEVSQEFGVDIECSVPTIRKDMQTLRNYGILEKRMYRWGYYLGTGVMSREELNVALNALASLAEYQRSPKVMTIYESLKKRLQGFDTEGSSKFLYPVRAQINRAIVHTHIESMVGDKQYKNTLFHSLDLVETAITRGQAIEIECSSDPYGGQLGLNTVYPLQLIFHDIAWYLLYEKCENNHLVIARIDRFTDYCRIIKHPSRSMETQRQSLETGHRLIDTGWGIYLGNPEEQKLEREGRVNYEMVQVRFFTPVIRFIEEGQKRHISQRIYSKGKPNFIDYQVDLPPRSLSEFSRWVGRFMENALVLSPKSLVEKHKESARKLNEIYNI